MSDLKANMVQVHVYRRIESGQIEYLLLQRASTEPLYPLLWQIVTGRMEEGESAIAAAKREVIEETGICTETMVVVPYIASFYFEPDDSIHHVPVFAVEVPEDTVVRLSIEHIDFVWLRFEKAWQRLVFPGHREGLRILRDYVISAM
ncbi:MAG: NUDIX pyrophosphatase [Bacteroidota bacterium]|jgi:8-oxo-dGTP pyrophosphatase MutT (NUDIX family)